MHNRTSIRNNPAYRCGYMFALEGGDVKACPHADKSESQVAWTIGFEHGASFRRSILADHPDPARARLTQAGGA